VRSAPDGTRTTVTTDAIGRTKTVTAVLGGDTVYSAAYEYAAGRDLVAKISYGNGTESVYSYDAAGRVKLIEHRKAGQAAFLKLEFLGYDGRGLVIAVRETRGAASATMLYTYDSRGRLVAERRIDEFNAYDLRYTYDAGGNRTSKMDLLNQITTTYFYDVSPSTPNWLMGASTRANRLLGYEVEDAAVGVLERVTYEYTVNSQGNVKRIKHKEVTDWDLQTGEPISADVYATVFTYHDGNDLRFVTQQFWMEDWFPGSSFVMVHDVEENILIREFRGQGRRRYMMRDRQGWHDTAGGEDNWSKVIPGSSMWTDYDGDQPTADYRVDEFGAATVEKRYALGLAEVDGDGNTSYHLSDQIGTTRTITSAVGIATAHIVYTAFGERVFAHGAVGTRYKYAGSWGYESFDSLDWGRPRDLNKHAFEFPYLHVGARYYDPSTGRFLQRNPIGIRGGANIYEVLTNPTVAVDPSGRGFWDIVDAVVGALDSGIVGGLIGGAVGGAVTGAIAGAIIGGPAGAAAGAIAGSIGGAISGAVAGGMNASGFAGGAAIGGLAGAATGVTGGVVGGLGATGAGATSVATGGAIAGGVTAAGSAAVAGGSTGGIIAAGGVGAVAGGLGGAMDGAGQVVESCVLGLDIALLGRIMGQNW
jgi:RHS repeat-associated protein